MISERFSSRFLRGLGVPPGVQAEQTSEEREWLSGFLRKGGAIPGKVFLDMLNEAGFANVELVVETGFNSSPVTKGALFRATKSVISDLGSVVMETKDALSKYQEFFNAAYAEGTIDRKTKHLIALGASLAAGCDP
ncbi:MAG: carboxymuconolactone decarboxylase family protein [Deltaproteobacteria bacterium]|nr:MAG: carboxymuconolactone decarboxylase family protein [Deltaproteobacteria bacterium]